MKSVIIRRLGENSTRRESFMVAQSASAPASPQEAHCMKGRKDINYPAAVSLQFNSIRAGVPAISSQAPAG
jgi:hypothetical protein